MIIEADLSIKSSYSWLAICILAFVHNGSNTKNNGMKEALNVASFHKLLKNWEDKNVLYILL